MIHLVKWQTLAVINVYIKFPCSILCAIYLERARELNNYLRELYCVSVQWHCMLMSVNKRDKKSINCLNYCYSVMTLNGSLTKIGLKREYNVCH